MNYRWKITALPTIEPISLTEAKLHLRVDHATDDTLITQLIKTARQYCENYQERTYIATTYQLKLDGWQEYIELPRPPFCNIDSITYVDSAGTTQTLSSTYYTVDDVSEPCVIYEAYGYSWPTTRGERNDITINYTAGYSASFTAVAASDVCTCLGRTFTEGTKVQLRNADGALPTGLSEGTNYYVRDVSGNTFKLYTAATGGIAVDITATGTGTHYIGLIPDGNIAAIKLLVAHLYEHRESAIESNLIENNIGLKALLMQDRVFSL